MNTTDSRVELLFDVAASPSLSPALRARALARLGARCSDGVLSVTASEHRSQLRNREEAETLRGDLQAVRPVVMATVPELWVKLYKGVFLKIDGRGPARRREPRRR